MLHPLLVSDSLAVWWVFILGLLVAAVLFVAVFATMVISHRRYVNLHRNHARRVLEAQEEERAWVSREVHDDAVQRLALIGKECGRTREALAALSAEQADHIAAIQTEVQDLGVFLRGLAHRLHPALIDRGGLRLALQGLCEEMERGYGIQVAARLPDEPALAVSPQRALVIYRIAQEALHNVAKHAAVPAAELVLTATRQQIELTVSDRGRGFVRSRQPIGDGIGLIGIQERAYLAGGVVEITSQPGQGTVVCAVFPAGKEAAP